MNLLKYRNRLKAYWFSALCLTFACGGAVHAETTDALFNVRVVLPGMTEIINVVQTGTFPLGFPQFFIFVAGKGSLGISIKNENILKETMLMLGAAQSSAGTIPIYRAGVSKGMIEQIVEIGDNEHPYGFVWLYCGVLLSEKDPVYLYELRLSLAP